MLAKYILAVLAVVLAFAAGLRIARDRGRVAAAARTWLLVAAIFAAVSGYLWLERV
jgi:hypothetical protein